MVEQESLCGYLAMFQARMWQSDCHQWSGQLLVCTCAIASNGSTLLAKMQLSVWATFVSHGQAFFLVSSPCSNVAGAVAWLRLGHTQGSHGKQVSHPRSFNPPSLPYFWHKEAFVYVTWVESRLSTALSPTSLPIEWSHLPFVRPRCWGTQYVAHHSLLRESLCQCNSFLLCHLPEVQVLTWLLLFPSYPIPCEFSLYP